MANGKSSTIEIDQATLSSLLRSVATFSAAAEALRKQIAALFPAKYGSDAWWENEEIQADADREAGKTKTFSSMEEAARWLDA